MAKLINVDSTINDEALVSAKEACERLGVKLATLYAYASRGLVRSVPGSGGRARRYVLGDIETLRARHDARAGHAAVAAGALRWGEPVLDSSLTGIDARGPRYRGHVAAELAERDTSFEAVAELLWTGSLPDARPAWTSSRVRSPRALAKLAGAPAHAFTVLPLVVASLAARDPARHGASPLAEIDRARHLVSALAAGLAIGREEGEPPSDGGVSGVVAWALGVRPLAASLRAIDAALVVSADHELNASSFAARIAASSGADLYACVSAALATLSGPLHGGACDRVEALLAEVERPERARDVVRDRARRGESLAGFGHRLYPAGDPRATLLLALAERLAPRAHGVRVALALVEAMRADRRDFPALDIGLVAVASALGAPSGSAAALFAIGRSAGWIAHVLEQRAAGFLLRPRARYVGP